MPVNVMDGPLQVRIDGGEPVEAWDLEVQTGPGRWSWQLVVGEYVEAPREHVVAIVPPCGGAPLWGYGRLTSFVEFARARRQSTVTGTSPLYISEDYQKLRPGGDLSQILAALPPPAPPELLPLLPLLRYQPRRPRVRMRYRPRGRRPLPAGTVRGVRGESVCVCTVGVRCGACSGSGRNAVPGRYR